MSDSTSGIQARFRLDYPGFTLDVDLDLPGRGVTALFGHSGSGKTSCLRCIAGLERAASARLLVNGELWQDSASGLYVPTHQRALGYVFQEASLFPHLTVQRNLDFGMKRVDPAQRRVDPAHICRLLGIEQLLQRKPDRLSGGERQRVGIARALLTSPRLLLMDEPLAALDLQRKAEILPYLERLHDELDIPVLYVSHAPDEVARLADHVVLMEAGQVVASGGLQQTLARLDLPLAFSEDAGVVIAASVGAHDEHYHLTRLDFAGGSVLVARRPEAPGQSLRFRVHARDVSLSLQPLENSSITNALAATVLASAPADTPAHTLVQLDAGGSLLLARIARRSADLLNIHPGQRLWAQIKTVALLG